MHQFFPQDDSSGFDIQNLMQELNLFFAQHGLGVKGTISALWEDMAQINESLVGALDDSSEENMECLYDSMIGWAQHIAHLVYYVGIAEEVPAPEGFSDFVMSVPVLQGAVLSLQEEDSSISQRDELVGFAARWMQTRQAAEKVLWDIEADYS